MSFTPSVGEVGRAIETSLNAGSFSQSFTAEFSYLPEFNLRDTDPVKVLVIVLENTVLNEDRTGWRKTYTVNVVVAKKVSLKDETTIDPYSQLAVEVLDYLKDQANRVLEIARSGEPENTEIGLTNILNDPVYDFELLHEQNLFLSVINGFYVNVS